MRLPFRLGHARTLPSPFAFKTTEASEIALTVFVVVIVGMMIIPLPTAVLDVLITTNLAFAVVLLLVTTQVANGLAFGSFPTILLVSTLFRLALNISSTRLILVQADAGKVIQSFGTYVVQGNYVVGAIVFFILTLVQYVVIAKGSERVAEVGARFTLDAMPGKQMAIDADLRAGALDYDQAQLQRKELHRESQFYGAMDGAMKFVKGDAIASIVIIGVNIVGGVIIGTLTMGFPIERSLKLFGLLTIGDGLVSQIPALLISTASALIVTRVASENERSSLASDMVSQVLGNPRALFTGGCLLAILALVPGLPTLPFGVLAAVLLVASRSAQSLSRPVTVALNAPTVSLPLFEIRLGSNLYESCTSGRGQIQLDQGLESAHQHLRQALAIELPLPAITLDRKLPHNGFSLLIKGGLVRASSSAARGIVDVLDAVRHVIKHEAQAWITMNTVQERLSLLRHSHPLLVNQVVPGRVSLASLTTVHKSLAQEGIGLQTLESVLEVFSMEAAPDKPVSDLLSIARVGVRRLICEPLSSSASLSVYTVDPMVEDAVRDAIVHANPTKVALAPQLRLELIQTVKNYAAGTSSGSCILVTQSDVRRPLWLVLSPEIPNLTVLSYDEIAPAYRLNVLGNVTPAAA
jgi:type III secretory pathway component EscV